VLSIYDRAVNRHPGSSALWREYLDYTAATKASKRWRKTMTNALRMRPVDHELWVMAGRRSARNGDMAAARGFFMRGCRFCNKDCVLWVEYARCEMEWLERMDKRKKMGIVAKTPHAEDEDELRLIGGSEEEYDDDEDENTGLLLPEPTKTQAKVIDTQTATQLASNPAMDGAIPLAIFNIAQKQPFFDAEAAESFFKMFTAFGDLPAIQPRISQHVLNAMDETYPAHPATCNCHVLQPILGVSPHTAEFPRGLRLVLVRLGEQMGRTTDVTELQRKTAKWVDEYLALEDLDESIRKVLEHTKAKYGSPLE
jgi:U3 small nucleolar RNA-associated protein 6